MVLGDLFETGEQVEEVTRVLREVRTVGVWGNHDLGFCHEPDRELVIRYSQEVADYFATLSARYELRDMLCSHGLATWALTDPTVYYSSGFPWESSDVDEVFATFKQRVFLTGHFHRRYLRSGDRPSPWNDKTPCFFEPEQRHFVVMHAVLDGWCAMLDMDANRLAPLFVG